jgi:flagellar motor protein MotB
MQLGEQAMAQQLQEMAQGQESIASDLGDLADDPGSEEALGDLEELAVQAAMLAEQMAQGRLTPEMVREQERLFHRLLDAGRSLEREEFSNDRESEVAGVFDREGVVPLTPDQLGALRFELPSAEQLQRLSPAVRQLVLQYFERLNGVGAGGGGPS